MSEQEKKEMAESKASVETMAPEARLQSEFDFLVQHNADLENSNAILIRSNHDFERSMFIVSHDLQEHIRIVTLYAQLLDKRYSSQDDDARLFIRNILGSAARMREILCGLLAHTHAGVSPHGPRQIVDLNDVMEIVKANLKPSVDEARAVVTSDRLPVLSAYSSDFISLFQNLIANAIKYRGVSAPRVHISADETDGQILFAVSDNGVGIDPKYHGQIFEPFQRLHGSSIPGIGLGLAICRRLMERYEGQIWVESEPGRGAKFLFSLPTRAVEPD